MTEYPLQPRYFTSPYNEENGGRLLLDTIAIWFDNKSDYQIYTVDQKYWPIVSLKPILTDRPRPYYFATEAADAHSYTITVYRSNARIYSYVDIAIWYTGGWLCKKTGDRLKAKIPILGVSDASKLPWLGNVGLVKDGCDEYYEWREFQRPYHTHTIIHNRARPILIPTIQPVPFFVAEALIEKAQTTEQQCPISMELITKGNATVTSCFHVFQTEAIQEWLKKSVQCPVCKKECAITSC